MIATLYTDFGKTIPLSSRITEFSFKKKTSVLHINPIWYPLFHERLKCKTRWAHHTSLLRYRMYLVVWNFYLPKPLGVVMEHRIDETPVELSFSMIEEFSRNIFVQ